MQIVYERLNQLDELIDKIAQGKLVEVVKCEDCKYNKDTECPMYCAYESGYHNRKNKRNDYCSYGERK